MILSNWKWKHIQLYPETLESQVNVTLHEVYIQIHVLIFYVFFQMLYNYSVFYILEFVFLQSYPEGTG